ncbi:MAG TPA: hypothetical protein ENK18_10710 [Deltaproteobacteria bacterium]|nr:hypothetical protein [Deltaproteobacteria bacterium]
MSVTWFIVAGLARSAAAGCDPAALERNLEAAEAAFTAGDPSTAQRTLSRARRVLGCTPEALSATTCARLHRATALTRWLKADQGGAEQALRAMIHADPLLSLDPELLPATHPLHRLRILAEEARMSWSDAIAEEALIDGVRTGVVPIDRPYVIQHLKGDTITGGRWVRRSDTSLPLPDHSESSPRARALWYSGLGLGAGGAVMYGAALGARASYNQAVEAHNDLLIGPRHTVTNALSIGSVSAAALSLGALTASELLRRPRR